MQRHSISRGKGSNSNRNKVVLLGAVLAMVLTTCSAFVSTPPVASSSYARSQQGSLAGVPRNRGIVATGGRERRPSATTKMMLGGDVGSLPVEALHSAAMFLAEEMEAPPNIYGPIAMGGVGIVLSGVVTAFVVSALILTMTPEQLQEFNESLEGGDQLFQLKQEEQEQQKRFKAVERSMDESKDPTFGIGNVPSGKRAERLKEETARALETDVASMDDEYD